MSTVSIRRAISLWRELVRFSQNEDRARSLNEKNVLHRSFTLYRKRANQQIEFRKAGRKSTVQMKIIQAFVGGIEAEKAKKRLRERTSQRRITMAIEKDNANKVEEAARRKTIISKQTDAYLLILQQRQRKDRVRSDLGKLDELFESKWATKQENALTAGQVEIDSWIESAEFEDLLLKKEHELVRSISLGSGVRNDQEIAISSPSAIAYSIVDGHLAGANMCADEFLHCFTSDRISFEQFQTALEACKVTLDTNELKSIFNDLCTASPQPQRLTLDDLNEIRQLSNEYIAPEGAPWKMYVSHKQELLFHCIVTNEKIFESDITKKQIKRIVRENSRSFQMKVRRELYREKCKARELMMKHYRAKQIQYMYRRWKGRSRIKRRWKVIDECPCQLSLENCVSISIESSSVVLDWDTIKMI